MAPASPTACASAGECDYQAVTVNVTTDTGEFRVECRGRRKGGSTWQDVNAKPSFKIKCNDRIDLGNHNCTGIEQCPGDGKSNKWQSKKFILNNGGEGTDGIARGTWYTNKYFRWGEVDFYVMFRKIGGFAWPFAQWVDVQVLHEDEEINYSQYILLENIDDKDFGKKWFGEIGWGLWEVEGGDGELQRDYGNFDCEGGTDVCVVGGSEQGLPPFARVPVSAFNHTMHGQDAMLRYYVAEQLGGHVDGACSRTDGALPHNHYLATNGTNWYILPHGADNTYFGCRPTRSTPMCHFMQQCMENASCAARLAVIDVEARLHAHRIVPSSCLDEYKDSIVNISIGFVVPCALIVCSLLWRRRWSVSDSHAYSNIQNVRYTRDIRVELF